MKHNILILFIGVLLANAAIADDESPAIEVVEAWKCYAFTDFDRKNVVVDLTRMPFLPEMRDEFIKELGLPADFKLPPDIEIGLVEVAGVEYGALFRVDGFNRKWHFGPEMVDFMFQINPDGNGYYFDFTSVTDGDSTSSSQTYNCELSK